jgi:hypothetical protein
MRTAHTLLGGHKVGNRPRAYILKEEGKRKVKLSLYRPWRPLGLRDVEAPTISDIRLIDGGKVVGPMRRPFFIPQEDSW